MSTSISTTTLRSAPPTTRNRCAASSPTSIGDKAVDLAIAEPPDALLLDHAVGIAAAGADLRSLRAVLHHGPVGADLRLVAVQRDNDVGHQVDRARPVVAGAGSDVARLLR